MTDREAALECQSLLLAEAKVGEPAPMAFLEFLKTNVGDVASQ